MVNSIAIFIETITPLVIFELTTKVDIILVSYFANWHLVFMEKALENGCIVFECQCAKTLSLLTIDLALIRWAIIIGDFLSLGYFIFPFFH
mgnify:CR=1 FL=1